MKWHRRLSSTSLLLYTAGRKPCRFFNRGFWTSSCRSATSSPRFGFRKPSHRDARSIHEGRPIAGLRSGSLVCEGIRPYRPVEYRNDQINGLSKTCLRLVCYQPATHTGKNATWFAARFSTCKINGIWASSLHNCGEGLKLAARQTC